MHPCQVKHAFHVIPVMQEHQLPIPEAAGGKTGEIDVDELSAVIYVFAKETIVLLYGLLFAVWSVKVFAEFFGDLHKIHGAKVV